MKQEANRLFRRVKKRKKKFGTDKKSVSNMWNYSGSRYQEMGTQLVTDFGEQINKGKDYLGAD